MPTVRLWTNTTSPEATQTSQPKDIICEETVRACVETFRERLLSVVLTGSLARGESTVVANDDAGLRVLGDAEFLAILDRRAPLPSALETSWLCLEIERCLSRRGIACDVGVSPLRPQYLQRLAPRVFSYELRRYGQVVWGREDVLSFIRPFTASEIPLEDAFRILCNRIIELLEIVGRASLSSVPPHEVEYKAVKLYLDMATSFLVFRGAYEPSYRQRAEALETIAERELGSAGSPFPCLGTFSQRVRCCTSAKLQGDAIAPPASWSEALLDARLLWCWELQELVGPHRTLSGAALALACARRQPLRQKLRGWAYVLRKVGWRHGSRHWLRWARSAWRMSPRYAVYSATGDLLFGLPVLRSPNPDSDQASIWARTLLSLPLVRPGLGTPAQAAWQTVAAEIAWNYHEFLEATAS